MKQTEIKKRIVEIAERAEYAGRQRGIAIKTRSEREARAAHENADISERQLHVMVAKLAADIVEVQG